MRSTALLLKQCVRVTMFSRKNCSLCDEGKEVLSRVWNKKPFEYSEVDVMAKKQEKWKASYEFDVPVVHFDIAEEGSNVFETAAEAKKLFHRWSEIDVQQAIDDTLVKAK